MRGSDGGVGEAAFLAPMPDHTRATMCRVTVITLDRGASSNGTKATLSPDISATIDLTTNVF